jgi:membrane fusion protein, multidrug efflux system
MKWTPLGLLLAIAACVGGCESKATIPPRPLLPVKAQTARFEDYSTRLSLTGEIQARNQADLSFRVSGRVIERDADVGQHVDAGAILAKIDPTEQQADVDAANAAVTAAEATLRQASTAFDRQKSLFDSGYATRSTYDSARQAQQTAEGTLESAKAQAATARDALSYSELRAAQAGVITARNIEVGEIAQAAETAFTLAVDGPRDAVFKVYESIFFRKTATGEVELSLVSNPEIRTVGHVREVAPVVDVNTGTVRVKVGMDDAPKEMALGSAVTGAAAFDPHPVVTLPWSATTSKDGKVAVWVVDPASKAVALRTVEVDAYENETLLIRNGVKDGETIVTEGVKFLYPGQIVDVLEPAR